MADVVSNIVLQFKTDTRQAKRGLKELQGEQKKTAQAALKSAESQNEALDAQIARWGKIAAGVGAATVAVAALAQATKRYGEIARVEQAAARFDLDDISQAAQGLVSNYEAAAFAAKVANGTFRLTQEEAETALKAATVLARQTGQDISMVAEEVGKAILEGEVEPVKKFGLVIRDVQPGLEAHIRLKEELVKVAARSGELIDGEAEAIRKTEVSWQNALDNLTKQLGRIGVALAPVVQLIAAAAESIGDIFEAIDRAPSWLSERMYGAMSWVNDFGADSRSASRGAAERERAMRFLRERGPVMSQAELERNMDEYGRLTRVLVHSARWAGIRFFENMTDWMGSSEGKASMRTFLSEAASVGAMTIPDPLAGARTAIPSMDIREIGARRYGSRSYHGAGIASGQLQQKYLDDQTESIYNQTRAWMTLQDAMVSATAAMISGSMSMGEAVKAMTAQILGALGNEMLVKAAREIAEGFAAMANPITAPTAGAHFAAAAKFSAGAALAYGFAGAMGRSGGRRGAASGGGRAMPPAAAGAVGGVPGGAGSSVVIYVGSDFEDNPRANAQRLRKAFDRADRTRPGGSAVVNG